MTVIYTGSGTEVILTDHDRISCAGQRESSVGHPVAPCHVGVGLHLYPDTPIHARLYHGDHRAVLMLGGSPAELDLYLPATQIDRLVNLLTAVQQRLSQPL